MKRRSFLPSIAAAAGLGTVAAAKAVESRVEVVPQPMVELDPCVFVRVADIAELAHHAYCCRRVFDVGTNTWHYSDFETELYVKMKSGNVYSFPGSDEDAKSQISARVAKALGIEKPTPVWVGGSVVGAMVVGRSLLQDKLWLLSPKNLI